MIFFFNDTATTEIYTLSLHDALPICLPSKSRLPSDQSVIFLEAIGKRTGKRAEVAMPDRKSTRLNSSHLVISYAVFCLKKKNTTTAIVHIVSSVAHRQSVVTFHSRDL